MQKIIVYICPQLHEIVTESVIPGSISYIITCPTCSASGFTELATSQGVNKEPDRLAEYEWYDPTEKELMKLKAVYPKAAFDNVTAHIAKGGLLLRKKETV